MIGYQPGKGYGEADALTCQGHEFHDESDLQVDDHTQPLLNSNNLGLLADILPQMGVSLSVASYKWHIMY
jgi:hypothetical protein